MYIKKREKIIIIIKLRGKKEEISAATRARKGRNGFSLEWAVISCRARTGGVR